MNSVKRIFYINKIHEEDFREGTQKLQVGMSPRRTEYYDTPITIEVSAEEKEYQILYRTKYSNCYQITSGRYLSIKEFKESNVRIAKDLIEVTLHEPSMRIRGGF